MHIPATQPATNAATLEMTGFTPWVSIDAATAAPNVIEPSAVMSANLNTR